MALCRRPYGYSKVDKEDPEDIIHRRAQFLIHKVLEQADSRRKPSCLRIRISKMKVKIGKRLRRLRRRIMSGVSAARLGFHGHVMSQIKTWKRLFSRGRQSQTLITLPPLIKWWCVSMCKHFTRKLMFYAIQCHVNFCPFSFCVFFPVFFSLYKEWNHKQFCLKIHWVVLFFFFSISLSLGTFRFWTLMQK